MDKKRYLFIITSIQKGGIEIYLLRFLKQYKGEFTSFVLFSKLEKDVLFCEKYIDAGAEIVYLPVNYSPVKLYKFLKTNKIDTICDFRGDFSGISLFVAWLVNVKNRISFYRESEYQFKYSFVKILYAKFISSLTRSFSTKILSNSNQALHHFFTNDYLKDNYTKIIRNGVYNDKVTYKDISIRGKYGIPENAFVVGHVGRFTDAKNHSTIIKIAELLCDKYDDIYFLLCGRNVSDIELNEKTSKRIITPGNCEDIPVYLNTMDMFIYPSLNEGQPNALIEAQIQALPIAASNIATILETVSPMCRDVLFNPDDIDSFINEILKIRNGEFSYDVEKVTMWTKAMYNQKDRFDEFYRELL